jgi:PAS domain-containing protein
MEEPLYVLDHEKIKTTSYMVSVYDHDLKIKLWNHYTENKFGILSGEAIGKCLTSLFPGYDKDFRLQVMKDAVSKRKSYYFPDLPYQYGQGSYSQIIIPVPEGIAIISSDNDGITTIARRDLIDSVCA